MFSPVQYPIDPLYYFEHQLTWCNAITKIRLILAGFGPGRIHSVISVSILTGHSSFQNVKILITVWDAIDPLHYFEQQLTWCDANTKIQLIPALFSNREVHSVISVNILTGPFQFSEYDDAYPSLISNRPLVLFCAVLTWYDAIRKIQLILAGF